MLGKENPMAKIKGLIKRKLRDPQTGKIVESENWYMRVKRNGVVFQECTGTANQREAHGYLVSFLAGLEGVTVHKAPAPVLKIAAAPAAKAASAATAQPPAVETIDTFADRFLEHKKADGSLSENTLRKYQDEIVNLQRSKCFENVALSDITIEHVNLFKQFRKNERNGAKIGMSTPTINSGIRVLRCLLHTAKQFRVIQNTNTEKWEAKVKGSRYTSGERKFVFSPEQENAVVQLALKEYPGSCFPFLFVFLNSTGLRRSEVLGLRKKDVTKKDGATFIEVTQSKSDAGVRKMKLSPKGEAALNAAVDMHPNSEFVFSDEHGQKLCSNYPMSQLRWLCDQLGMPQAVLHSCRHTFASRLAARKASPYQIRDLCGHSSLIMTDRYTHSNAEANDAAIDLLD
jgi:integrase